MLVISEPPFPSSPERTAAAGLLLLSTTDALAVAAASPSGAKAGFDAEFTSEVKSVSSADAEKSLSLVSSGSGSCISSSEVVPAHKLRILAVVPRGYDLKLKVVRKKRTKVFWCSTDSQKLARGCPPSSKSDSMETSCLSSASTAVSSLTNKTEESSFAEKWRKKKKSAVSISSCGLKRQADSILKLLARSSSSEVRIRQLLGDSPDTSKALRMLLRREEIKRSGSGGRQDPYIYKVA